MNDHRSPVYRDDGELVGFVTGADDAWTPLAVFGVPLGEPTTRPDAERFLRDSGLAVLADVWLVEEGDVWQRANIVEAEPGRVVVQLADFEHPDSWGLMRTLVDPTGTELKRS